jgi:LysM repeat protein
MKTVAGRLFAAILICCSLVIGALFSPALVQTDAAQTLESQATATPTETIPPYTPLPSLTPSSTLRPPPTFEPPTPTRAATSTPTITPTATLYVGFSVPGLNGLETPTPTSTPGCEVREDWQLTYTIQPNDTLTSIAQRYNVSVYDLAEGNCLSDPNIIINGQQLRVPGAAHPTQGIECTPWEVLTPVNGAVTIAGNGPLTFNWRGPQAPLNLIRVFRPDGSMYEILVELRQNETIADIATVFPAAGTYTWYVIPLGRDFRQIDCLQGGPWTFTKAEAPPPTATLAAP